MSFALSAGVTGLQAHQKMLDIAGNNLANVNTTAFKSSRITFSDLLNETIKKASQPTSGIGGTKGGTVFWSTWGLQKTETGALGDPTEATAETGAAIAEGILEDYCAFIEEFYNWTGPVA